MEGIFVGQITNGLFSTGKTTLTFNTEDGIRKLHSAIRYSDSNYVLVESDEVIKTNDELLKLRDRVKELEEELMKIKTARNLREAYVKGIEKGCESLREERDRLEKNLAAAQFSENYWRRTYITAAENAKEAGVCMFISGEEQDKHSARVFVVNERADDLEKQIKRLEEDNSIKASALISAQDRGDYWLREYSVKSRMYQELKEKHDAKWSAMMWAFKDKGVEVIYMGEEDGNPIIDIKIPGWESDKE